jgi:porphobilinogen deaminase
MRWVRAPSPSNVALVTQRPLNCSWYVCAWGHKGTRSQVPQPLLHEPTMLATAAERAFMRVLEVSRGCLVVAFSSEVADISIQAGCTMPICVRSTWNHDTKVLSMLGRIFSVELARSVVDDWHAHCAEGTVQARVTCLSEAEQVKAGGRREPVCVVLTDGRQSSVANSPGVCALKEERLCSNLCVGAPED